MYIYTDTHIYIRILFKKGGGVSCFTCLPPVSLHNIYLPLSATNFTIFHGE